MRWARFHICALLLATVVSPATFVWAQTSQPAEVTPEVRAAVDRGMAWLATQQRADGSFGSHSHYGRHVAITALAGMGFLSSGSQPDRGPYAYVLDGCINFILASSGPNGLLSTDNSHGPMYGHGFATLFLAEIYGTTDDSRVGEALRKAVHLIVECQNAEGGWRYQPVPDDADLSVTVCEVMALRAARNVGIYVPKATIERAIQYIRRSQNADGGFRYMLNTGGSAFARSAAGVAALQYAGIYEGGELERALQYVRQHLPGRDDDSVGHFFYGHYYAVQAMFLAGGDSWSQWWPAIRDDLVKRQLPNGAWEGQAGDEYGTAMALIILQVPQRWLPIFQR